MIASKRERVVAAITVGVLGLLVADRFVLTPLFARSGEVNQAIDITDGSLQRAERLQKNAPRINDRWRAMQAAGLKAEVTEAESQALRSLNEWAREAGIALVSLQPDRVEIQSKQKEFAQLTLRVSGTGSMRAISHYLWRVQTAAIPMRITNLELMSRAIGGDDLTLTLAVSTLCLAPPTPATTPRQPTIAMAGSSREGM
jgi:hypothetical protein